MTRWCSPRTSAYFSVPRRLSKAVEPSMSVKRKVAVPRGSLVNEVKALSPTLPMIPNASNVVGRTQSNAGVEAANRTLPAAGPAKSQVSSRVHGCDGSPNDDRHDLGCGQRL